MPSGLHAHVGRGSLIHAEISGWWVEGMLCSCRQAAPFPPSLRLGLADCMSAGASLSSNRTVCRRLPAFQILPSVSACQCPNARWVLSFWPSLLMDVPLQHCIVVVHLPSASTRAYHGLCGVDCSGNFHPRQPLTSTQTVEFTCRFLDQCLFLVAVVHRLSVKVALLGWAVLHDGCPESHSNHHAHPRPQALPHHS